MHFYLNSITHAHAQVRKYSYQEDCTLLKKKKKKKKKLEGEDLKDHSKIIVWFLYLDIQKHRVLIDNINLPGENRSTRCI